MAYYYRRIGFFVMMVGLAALMIGSMLYPSPGSFNTAVAMPDVPLLGFIITLTVLAGTVAGFAVWLTSFGMAGSEGR